MLRMDQLDRKSPTLRKVEALINGPMRFADQEAAAGATAGTSADEAAERALRTELSALHVAELSERAQRVGVDPEEIAAAINGAGVSRGDAEADKAEPAETSRLVDDQNSTAGSSDPPERRGLGGLLWRCWGRIWGSEAQCYGGRVALNWLVITVLLTILSSLVISELEIEAAHVTHQQNFEFLRQHIERYNVTGSDAQSLADELGYPLKPPDPQHNEWWPMHSSSVLFAFTIVSTIGYGNIAPVTIGGKMFLAGLALIGVPMVGTCFQKTASFFLQLLELRAVKSMPQVRESFDHIDTDGSGWLNKQEFANALKELGMDKSKVEVNKLFHKLDSDKSGKLEFREFEVAVSKLKLPIERTQRAFRRLRLAMAAFALHMAFGTVIFAALEEWAHVDSFYFCVITLTTVGLGDFVPSTDLGIECHLIYCLFGLALLSLLLTTVVDYQSALLNDASDPHLPAGGPAGELTGGETKRLVETVQQLSGAMQSVKAELEEVTHQLTTSRRL